MGFRFKCVGLQLIVLLWVLPWGSIVGASNGDPAVAEITVLVHDTARISPSVLNRAELETARIFRAAGIEIVWVNCSGESTNVDDECRHAPGANQFLLHIVPTGKTSTDSVFGLAFLGEDGSGSYCDVFFDRIEEATRALDTNVSQLLGTVAAHELGHLLLGSHGHSRWGIMEPTWKEESLRQIGMGTLLFSREQSALMKTRIGRDGLTLASFRARTQR
jgi:hypothetical protein